MKKSLPSLYFKTENNEEFCRDKKQKSPNTFSIRAFLCTPVGIRTPNLLIRSQMLYPIELRVHITNFDTNKNLNLISRVAGSDALSEPVPMNIGMSYGCMQHLIYDANIVLNS